MAPDDDGRIGKIGQDGFKSDRILCQGGPGVFPEVGPVIIKQRVLYFLAQALADCRCGARRRRGRSRRRQRHLQRRIGGCASARTLCNQSVRRRIAWRKIAPSRGRDRSDSTVDLNLRRILNLPPQDSGLAMLNRAGLGRELRDHGRIRFRYLVRHRLGGRGRRSYWNLLPAAGYKREQKNADYPHDESLLSFHDSLLSSGNRGRFSRSSSTTARSDADYRAWRLANQSIRMRPQAPEPAFFRCPPDDQKIRPAVLDHGPHQGRYASAFDAKLGAGHPGALEDLCNLGVRLSNESPSHVSFQIVGFGL